MIIKYAAHELGLNATSLKNILATILNKNVIVNVFSRTFSMRLHIFPQHIKNAM